ncbi:hypothetical protein IMCC3317_46300 [Kordia antarctica]|uniref:Uncharacterized protein n=1 Tax=Kordia antarctica TaxID=1218801 RepID=A0A7L4ZRF2_9FLAO|nr:hypothetical protein [Kordia antarctica]QHI39225.1 hypothetical protein IMCC3317_46300 [Kordia antarctica]
MKKILITLVLIMAFVSTYGQNKYHERQNKVYIEAAAAEYSLDDKQQAELSEARMEMVAVYVSSNKAFKNDEISKEKKQELTREASKLYHNKMSKITGKSYKDMKPFLEKMREELKKVK